MDEKSVLIVILNYLTYRLTLDLVSDLNNLRYSNYSLLVIDNASPNESGFELANAAKKLGYTFIQNDQNTGYAAGNNIGIRYGIEHGYDYTWILNNDVKIEDWNCLSELVFVAESKPDIGCIGPKILDINKKICAPYCTRPNLWELTFGMFSQKIRRKLRANVEGYVYRVHGCCMLLKNHVMKTVDCMDERTFLFREEEILAERMLNEGFRCYYYPGTSIIHMESSSVSAALKRKDKKKLEIILNSMRIYLTDYRGYQEASVRLCLLVRSARYYLRG